LAGAARRRASGRPYFLGWKKRYFVLAYGVLAYYDNKSEAPKPRVNNTCSSTGFAQINRHVHRHASPARRPAASTRAFIVSRTRTTTGAS